MDCTRQNSERENEILESGVWRPTPWNQLICGPTQPACLSEKRAPHFSRFIKRPENSHRRRLYESATVPAVDQTSDDRPRHDLIHFPVSERQKVAQAGDRVIALHVLGSNETVDRNGKSSLFSLVKAFDSVLAVYEGFCNLKQVAVELVTLCVRNVVAEVILALNDF
ncbi:hypothetical protein F0562_017268 [Nyssa sinensis]|uniref:Uncharacterized protein n=1 Tax=Nyssa sinensis TaxID=561372 RepID=A0A5J4ZGE8_9ASTE|nr:hypothetical protein F0562_017268 [Nyssa sinensis]